MKKIRKVCLCGAAAVALCSGVLAMSACKGPITAYAENPDSALEIAAKNEVEPRGAFTSLKLYMEGGNGEVWAGAKNSFTLFPSKVHVYIELYSSSTYQDDYTNMTLVSSNYIDDLNIGKSIEARASTNNEQKYWKARAHFKVDGKEWSDLISETRLFTASGFMIEV